MKIRLHVQDGPKNYDFEHAGTSVALGRNPAGDLVLEEDGADSVVSWEHARIDLSPREATLTDLRSTNGTYRNGVPVTGTVPLWPNDAVRFGQTGPVLTVKSIDLTPAPRVGPPVLPAKRKPAAPVMSETRSIALQAMQELMTQQDELRVQQAAHARHRRALATVAAVALLLFLLLGGGLLVYKGRLARVEETTGTLETGLDKTKQNLAALAEQHRKQAQDAADRFAKIDQDVADQRNNLAKIEQAARQVIDQEAAKLHVAVEQLKQNLGASVDDLNRRLTANPKDNPPAPAPPAVRGGVVPRIEPGMKMDVVLKQGAYYTGVLLGIDGTHIRLQTIPDPKARPSEFDIKDVQAFQTRDGVFAFNEGINEFEAAVTYFRFNKSSNQFERMDASPYDAYLCDTWKCSGRRTRSRRCWRSERAASGLSACRSRRAAARGDPSLPFQGDYHVKGDLYVRR